MITTKKDGTMVGTIDLTQKVVITAEADGAFVASYTTTVKQESRMRPRPCDSREEFGSGGRIRTYDMAVNSRPLYH
jgi:hypothetical protein